jgi:hypothetical protein
MGRVIWPVYIISVIGISGQQSDITPVNVVMRNTAPALLSQNTPVRGTFSIPYPPVTISLDGPTNLAVGGRFVTRANISLVSNFKAFQFDLTFDPAVIRIVGAEGGFEGVMPGRIESVEIPIDMWSYIGSPGKVRVLGNIPGDISVTGEGYIAEFTFQVIGALNTSTQLNFTNAPPILRKDYLTHQVKKWRM